MNRTREDIIEELVRAANGPLGPRSLADTIRKSKALLMMLLSERIKWRQIAALYAETGHNASAETIRRTFNRIKAEDKGVPQAVLAPFKGDVGNRRDTPSAEPLRQNSNSLMATGPPVPPTSSPFNTTQGDRAVNTGASLLDDLKKLKELDK